MNKFLRNSLQGLLLALSLLPLSVFALNSVQDEGTILQLNNAFINLSDSQYSLLSTVKVINLVTKKSAGLSDLGIGDKVRVKLIFIAKKQYVDTIYIVKNLAQNETNRESVSNDQ